MPIQVSHGHISRADAIRENAIILLERELSEAFDTPTTEPCSQTQTHQATSWIEHVITFSIFIAVFYAIFTAVTR